MPDDEQLPHLLKLLDDDSETVRKAVAEALAAYGPTLKWKLAELADPPDRGQMEKIRKLLKRHTPSGPSVPEEEEAGPLLEPGDLVRHRRYGYRGVVVDLDATCQASDAWYHANRSQPDRDQPWYYVLVHGSDRVTYAAQTSLLADGSGEEVSHPYVPHFFTAFQDGHYVRNDRPWPGHSKDSS